MASRGSVIQPMRRHHLVLEALPELFHALFHVLTLEGVQVFDYRIVLWGPLELQPRLLLGCLSLIGICI